MTVWRDYSTKLLSNGLPKLRAENLYGKIKCICRLIVSLHSFCRLSYIRWQLCYQDGTEKIFGVCRKYLRNYEMIIKTSKLFQIVKFHFERNRCMACKTIQDMFCLAKWQEMLSTLDYVIPPIQIVFYEVVLLLKVVHNHILICRLIFSSNFLFWRVYPKCAECHFFFDLHFL